MATATLTRTASPKSRDTAPLPKPFGYYDLPVGTRFILLGYRTVPINGLHGETKDDGCFYPNCGGVRYPVFVREEMGR